MYQQHNAFKQLTILEETANKLKQHKKSGHKLTLQQTQFIKNVEKSRINFDQKQQGLNKTLSEIEKVQQMQNKLRDKNQENKKNQKDIKSAYIIKKRLSAVGGIVKSILTPMF
ncbi:MAG: hypothetical protein GY821_08655 [Gammaproteobacteria bacterium]|nr:hypothetical protein [Gammaproteobacteria bacterium]